MVCTEGPQVLAETVRSYSGAVSNANTFDESGLERVDPYTLVLEHYVARHVSMHSFTETMLHTRQRGQIAQWPPRMGTREVF